MEASGDQSVAPTDLEVLHRIEAAQEADVVERALTAARERLRMDAAYITTIDSRYQTIDATIGARKALGSVQNVPIPLEQTYCARMLAGEMPNVVPDTRLEPAVRDLPVTRVVGSYVGVPVKLSDGRVHGTLCCASSTARTDLGSQELRFMHVLANIVAARVEQVQGNVARLTARFREKQGLG